MVNGELENSQRVYLEEAFNPGGVIETIAQSVLEQPAELTPVEVAEVILPSFDQESIKPRWQLVAEAKDAIKTAANDKQDALLEMASRLGMRREESITQQDLVRIQPDKAVWTVEAGANRTSVVRRALMLGAMRQVYGQDLSGQPVFQFGSNRQIPKQKGEKPNPEYSVALEIGGAYLPDIDIVTEFEVGLASALESGYQIDSDIQHSDAAERVVTMHKDNCPELLLVLPYQTEKGGLENGFSAVSGLLGGLEDRQLVIASNGQYRPKDEAQALRWARGHDVGMLPPVALGDEPGFSVSHSGREITTADRATMVYLNEVVILYRLMTEGSSD